MNDNKELGNRLKAADDNYSYAQDMIKLTTGKDALEPVDNFKPYLQVSPRMKSEPQIIPDGQNHGEVLGGLIDEAVEEKNRMRTGLMDEMKNTGEPSVKPLTIEDVDEHNKRVLEERHLKEEELQQFLRYQNCLIRRRLHVGGSNYTPPKNKNKRRAEKKSRKKNR